MLFCFPFYIPKKTLPLSLHEGNLFTIAALLISLMTMSSSLYMRGVAEPTTLSPTRTLFNNTDYRNKALHGKAFFDFCHL